MLLIVSLAVPVAAIPPPDTSWNPPSETPSVKSGEPSGTPSITIPTQNVYYEYGGENWKEVYGAVSGNIAFWVQYGPAWGLKSAVYLGNTVRTAIYNDQYQYLYWVEIYPDGKWRYWGLGYHNSGWIMRYRFLGDAPGWHKILSMALNLDTAIQFGFTFGAILLHQVHSLSQPQPRNHPVCH
ncbi:MAG: hypothetical protein J7K36_00515 [Archaeoglobaceae archaeon]|nr:hypothetical protein [Archaeoglobaceae archaeon]